MPTVQLALAVNDVTTIKKIILHAFKQLRERSELASQCFGFLQAIGVHAGQLMHEHLPAKKYYLF
jgi:hypothetical protein